jgi:hypothetical protein
MHVSLMCFFSEIANITWFVASVFLNVSYRMHSTIDITRICILVETLPFSCVLSNGPSALHKQGCHMYAGGRTSEACLRIVWSFNI